MKALTAAVFGITIASAVTWGQSAVTGAKPAFDWTQFIKGVKRAATTNAEPSSEEIDIDYQDAQFQMKPIASNPMSPFLSLKPFLAAKPTFMPPAVDPQFFIDKKTEFLNGLFSSMSPTGESGSPSLAMAPNYFAGKKTAFLSTLFSQLATPPPQTGVNKTTIAKSGDTKVIQRRLIAPWLTTAPPFDPKVMADKKTAFLDKLFSSINSATSDVNALGTATLKPTIVPPDFWLPFAAKSKVAPVQPAVKPTIVPPGFWFPYAPSKTDTITKPVAPIVDPSIFIDKKTKFLNDLMTSLSSSPSSSKPELPDQMAGVVPHSTSDPVSKDDEVSEFLDKLIMALTMPTLMIKRAVMDESYDTRKRSAPPSTVGQELESNPPLTAKDKVINTFIEELSGIKNNMVDTVTQMIKTQKESAKVATAPGIKPGKKVGPPFGGMWGPMGKLMPTADPTLPFVQKIDVLNQVFDMLTDLHKDVETALNEAEASPVTLAPQAKNSTNTTILDLLRKKFLEMDDGKVGGPQQMYGTPIKYNVRNVHDRQAPDVTGPRTRSIKMDVHQGYQSLPPGTTELLQAGGGSVPQGQEGGGIKLQITVPA